MKLTEDTISDIRFAEGLRLSKKKSAALILFLASREDITTELDVKLMYPNFTDKDIKTFLIKVKKKRKELASATGFLDIKGIQNFKCKGFIYLIVNVTFPGWVKCGMTTNLKSRLKQYNGYDPLCKFEYVETLEVEDRKKFETNLIQRLKLVASECSRNEWFRIEIETAKSIFKSL